MVIHDLYIHACTVKQTGLKNKCADALDDKGRDYLERMQSASRRMQTLIDGLLMYSRVSSQAQPFEHVDLMKITKEVVSDLEIRIEELGGKVEIDDMPVLIVDSLQIRQLFQNLIGNALKFHKKGEAPVVRITSMTSTNEGDDHEEFEKDSFIDINISDKKLSIRGEGRQDSLKSTQT